MTGDGIYSDELYASSAASRIRRAAELGWRYYLWALPRYFAHRRQAGLGFSICKRRSIQSLSFSRDDVKRPRLPRGYDEALRRLRARGVRLTLPPSRIVALLKCWETACSAPGDVIECGSYRGSTALLIALVSMLQGRRQKVLALDTFSRCPRITKYDPLQENREYLLPPSYVPTLHRLAASLGVEDQIEIHSGTFSDTFKALEHRPIRFAFAHIDANLYQSTFDACEFVIPRIVPHGAVVFDDYHGVCDLGARLAIDEYLAASKHRPLRLSGSSAVLRF